MQPTLVITDKKELLDSIQEPVTGLLDLMSHLDNNEVNKVPYEGSWTAGMLFRHVSKSIHGMSKALQMEGKPAGRNEAEKIPMLKNTFLDFTIKMNSPDFIIPEQGPYEKQAIYEELKKAFSALEVNTANAKLSDLVEGLPLGPVTKLEILHFVGYHTQRHLHQMKKIYAALKEA